MAEKKITKRIIQKHMLQTEPLETIQVKELLSSSEDVSTEEAVLAQEDYYNEEASSTNQNSDEIIDQNQEETAHEGVAAVDLMNFKLVRFEETDGQLGTHYRLVSNTEEPQIMTTINGEEVLFVSGDTIDIEQITKSNDDNEMTNNVGGVVQEHKYVQIQMEGSDVPIVMLACDDDGSEISNVTKNRPLQQKQYFKNNFSNNVASTKGGRRSLPPARELLSSPNFKLFLYSCKHCDFQCNAIKDLTKHRAEKHGNSSRNRSSGSWSAMRPVVSRKPDLTPYSTQESTRIQKL